MNKMKYIKEYKEFKSDIFYHGSNIKLDEIKLMPNTSSESKFLGDGIYISNTKSISDSYGEYTYSVSISEPLNSLQYLEYIPLGKFKEMSIKFQESDDEDLNYIGDEIEDAIEDDDLWWGKSLISKLDRYELNSKEILVNLGYNAIEAPINKMNQFRGMPDSDRNICIIKDDILSVHLVE